MKGPPSVVGFNVWAPAAAAGTSSPTIITAICIVLVIDLLMSVRLPHARVDALHHPTRCRTHDVVQDSEYRGGKGFGILPCVQIRHPCLISTCARTRSTSGS